MTALRIAIFTLLVAAGAQASTQYLLMGFPTGLKKQSDTISLRWTKNNTLPPSDSTFVLFGRAPGGSNPANYPYRVSVYDTATYNKDLGSVPPQRHLTFVPAHQPGAIMNAGFFYYIVATFRANDTLVSNEMTMIIKSASTAQNLSPNSVARLNEQSPLFRWDAVPGVPYYHIIVSDKPITIDTTKDPVSVQGISIVWEAITPENSIKYGEPDPSGTIPADAPPLSPSITYNWIVLNNYGNHQAYSDMQFMLPADCRNC